MYFRVLPQSISLHRLPGKSKMREHGMGMKACLGRKFSSCFLPLMHALSFHQSFIPVTFQNSHLDFSSALMRSVSVEHTQDEGALCIQRGKQCVSKRGTLTSNETGTAEEVYENLVDKAVL